MRQSSTWNENWCVGPGMVIVSDEGCQSRVWGQESCWFLIEECGSFELRVQNEQFKSQYDLQA